MARSAAEVATLLYSVATQIDRGRRTTMLDMALGAKEEMNEGVKKAGLPPGSSFYGRPNVFRGARFDLKGSANPVAFMSYRAPGPAAIFNAGAKPHAIVPKRYGLSKAKRGALPASVIGPGMWATRTSRRTTTSGRRPAIVTPQGVRAGAYHPGVRGRRFWPATQRRVEQVVPEIARQGLRRNIVAAGWGR